MDIAYISLLIFIIITIIYCFFGKIPITIGTGTVTEENYFNILSEVSNQNLMRIGIYFLIVLISQFIINTIYLVNKCGGSAANNIGTSSLITFLPWILFLGGVIVVLNVAPGFKLAFSNVVGYFAISSSANQILANILDTNVNIEENMAKEGLTDSEKTNLKKTSELILKLCGNNSFLINQMSPENFLKTWDTMKPLMKQIPGNEFIEERQQLLNLIVMKDNIGEMMWYIYTGILLTSIVQMKISTTPCYISPKQMEQNYQTFLEKENKVQQQNATAQSTVYTITS